MISIDSKDITSEVFNQLGKELGDSISVDYDRGLNTVKITLWDHEDLILLLKALGELLS